MGGESVSNLYGCCLGKDTTSVDFSLETQPLSGQWVQIQNIKCMLMVHFKPFVASTSLVYRCLLRQQRIIRSRCAQQLQVLSVKEACFILRSNHTGPTKGQYTTLASKHDVIFACHRPLQARTALNKFSDETFGLWPMVIAPGCRLWRLLL